jgi:hypothetical protein
VGDPVTSDFLALRDIFLIFAREYVEFPVGQRPSFWVIPPFTSVASRQPGWPDAHALRQGIELGQEFLATASGYVVERDGIDRDGLSTGPGRRFDLAREAKNVCNTNKL